MSKPGCAAKLHGWDLMRKALFSEPYDSNHTKSKSF